MLEADLVMWEVDYANGQTVKEANGIRYEDLNRNQIKTFRLVAPGEVLLEIQRPPGGKLVYRRRTAMPGGNRRVVFLVGWVPTGPVYHVDPQSRTVEVEQSFMDGNGRFLPPAALPEEDVTDVEMRGANP